MNAAQFIKIEGPIAKPSVRLDTQKAVAAGIQKGIDKGVEKLMKKTGLTDDATVQTTTTSTVREPMTLCAAALGHKLKGKKSFDITLPIDNVVIPKTAELAEQPKEEKQLTPQEILKKQLLQSITSAATGRTAPVTAQ